MNRLVIPTVIVITIVITIVIIYFCHRKNGGLEAFESVDSKPIENKSEYKDEVDYFMTPVAQAIRMENGLSTDLH